MTVVHVDLSFHENGKLHHTDRYEIMSREDKKACLVVRRGQEFFLNLTLSRDYDPLIDGVSLVFSVEGVDQPLFGHGTLAAVPLLTPEEESDSPWQASVEAVDVNALRIKVRLRKFAFFH